MKAMFSQAQLNTAMSCRRAERMPFAMPAMGMSAAAASIIISKTGVFTPVSLFSLLLIVVLLLVGLELIISLLLTCLTGLVRREGLVRLITKLATRSTQGD